MEDLHIWILCFWVVLISGFLGYVSWNVYHESEQESRESDKDHFG